jgi:hypothetical protein
MKHTYYNRHRDAIVFERIDDNTITMTGGKWMRFGWPNKYDVAYAHYLKEVDKLQEPDYDLLVEDITNNELRPYTEAEFEKAMQGNLHDYEERKAIPALKWLWKHVYSDRSTYDMVDPSGGPYLCTGMDLGEMIGFPESFVINYIGIQEDEQVIFKNVKQ